MNALMGIYISVLYVSIECSSICTVSPKLLKIVNKNYFLNFHKNFTMPIDGTLKDICC